MVVEIKKKNYEAIWKQLVCAKYDSNTSKAHMSSLWKEINVLH
jgi:hypothetical protein